MRTVWVADSAVVDSAVVWVGTVWVVGSPSMAAASFTVDDASTAVFVALPSTAAPSTPTATIAVGGGILAVTAT